METNRRWFWRSGCRLNPGVLILDDPTRGIDIGTKAEVHRLVSTLAAQGLAIILISNDLPEVLAMSDRLLVFDKGKIRAQFEAPPFNEELVMRASIASRNYLDSNNVDPSQEEVTKTRVYQRHS